MNRSNQKKNELIKGYSALFSGLALVTAVAYLYVYWGWFDINPFEYLAVSDLLLFSIAPLCIAVCFAVLFYLMARWLDFEGEFDANSFIIGFASIVFFLGWTVLTVVFLDFPWREIWSDGDRLGKYTVLMLGPLFVAFILGATMSEREFDWIPKSVGLGASRTYRAWFIGIVVLIPLQAVAYAFASALAISSGDSYDFVQSESFSDKLNLKDCREIPYIGKLGDYFFFWNVESENVLIMTHDQVVPFVLQNHGTSLEPK